MSKQIQVRLASANDRSVIWDWYSEKVRIILFPKKRSLDRHKASAWFDTQLNHPENLLIIGLVDIIRIGAVYFKHLGNREYEVFVTVKSHYSMQGYYPRLLMAALPLFKAKRGPHKIFMNIPDINPASRALMEREGFSLVDIGEKKFRWEEVCAQ